MHHMTIKSKPQKLAEFISKAPDSAAARPAPAQVQITLKLTGELLGRIDAAAKELGLTRAGFIKMSLSNTLKG
jgi:predicted DNA binding CopG/RHH family protein